MITWRMAAAWVLALVLATVLTWQIVGLADSQVGETPAAVAPTAIPSSTVPTTPSSTAPLTTGDTTSTTGAASSSSSSTSSTSPSTPTTSQPTTAEWSVRTINSPGGTVVVRYRPEQVELQAATPAAGFSVEVDDNGPDRVRVEFESGDDDFRVEARWEGGQLSIEVDD